METGRANSKTESIGKGLIFFQGFSAFYSYLQNNFKKCFGVLILTALLSGGGYFICSYLSIPHILIRLLRLLVIGNVLLVFLFLLWGIFLMLGRKTIFALIALGISFLSVLVILDIGLRIFNPFHFTLKGDRILLPKNEVITFANTGQLPGLDKKITKSTNILGFRGSQPPIMGWDKYFTILTIGGSTTQCCYISDGKTWPDLLEKAMKKDISNVWLNNAGIDGASTKSHIKLLEQYLVELKPKMVVFLIGLNDMNVASFHLANNKYVHDYDEVQFYKKQTEATYLEILARYSEIINTIVNIERFLNAKQCKITHGAGNIVHPGNDLSSLKRDDTLFQDKELEKTAAPLLESHKPFISMYEKKLERLIELCRENKIIPVFVTQISAFGFLDKNKQSSDRKLAYLLEKYNDATRTAARKNNYLLIDLACDKAIDGSCFYDMFHCNNKGCEEVAGYIAEKLIPYIKSLPDK